MSMFTSIITGEAAETDSEDESTTSSNNKMGKTPASVPGEIVNGEDSESDTDDASPKAETKEEVQTIPSPTIPQKRKFDSLLHKKLSENNIAVHKHLHTFLSTQVNEATSSLNNTDRQLMKSQLTLQAALQSLRVLNTNSVAIKQKLTNIVIDDAYLDNLVITRN